MTAKIPDEIQDCGPYVTYVAEMAHQRIRLATTELSCDARTEARLLRGLARLIEEKAERACPQGDQIPLKPGG
jgi:hypothetical protein